MSELREQFDRYCRSHDDCAECDFADKEYCHFDWATRKIRADTIDEYKDCLISRLIPFADKLSCVEDSETFKAITEIAEQLKEQNEG